MNIGMRIYWPISITNLAVVAGIIFLAISVQMNTQITKSQFRHAITENQLSFYEQISSDIEDVEVYIKGHSSFELAEIERGVIEQFQFSWMLRNHFKIWENEWYQFQQGLFESEEFEPRIALWGSVLSSPGYRKGWQSQRLIYLPEFREQVDEIIEDMEFN